MTEYSEKRDFQRMTLDSTLEYQMENDSKVHHGIIRNLSAKGLLFTTADIIPLGTKVLVTLTPVNNITPPMSASVNITRCDKISDDEFDNAGTILEIK